MIRPLLLSLSLFATGATQSQQLPTIESNVVSVTTLGHWKVGQSTGRYRLIVTTEGWEHVWSRAFVEWLPNPIDPNADLKAIAITELVVPVAPEGVMILDATARSLGANSLLVKVRATPNQDLSEYGVKSGVYTLEATIPGVIRMHQPTKRK